MIAPSTAAVITISNHFDAEGHVVGSVPFRMRLPLFAEGPGWRGRFVAAVATSFGQLTTMYTETVQAMRITLLPAEILPPGTPAAAPHSSGIRGGSRPTSTTSPRVSDSR